MKFLLLILFCLSGHITAFPQAVDKASKIEQVQSVVGSLVTNSSEAEFLLIDLSVIKGSVFALEENAFTLKVKMRKWRKGKVKILYKDVVAISGKNIAVSFIPDPDLRGFGKWEDILTIDYNHNLEAVLENGQIVYGRLNEKTKDKITLVGKTFDQKFSLPRNQIASVYQVWQEYDAAIERAFAYVFGAGIGAITGTIVGASRKESKLRILIYSK